MRGVRRCATAFKLHCFVVSVCKDVYTLSTAFGPQSLRVTEPLTESNESHVQVRFKLRLLRAALIQRQLTHLRAEPPMVKMSLPNSSSPVGLKISGLQVLKAEINMQNAYDNALSDMGSAFRR